MSGDFLFYVGLLAGLIAMFYLGYWMGAKPDIAGSNREAYRKGFRDCLDFVGIFLSEAEVREAVNFLKEIDAGD